MPKSDTIAAILRLNPTADPEFLVEFSNAELIDYLRRLEGLRIQRAPQAQRAVGTPPLVAAVAPKQPA